jgi:DHA1 family tetracycline resistance protein-like MFS transporter
MKPEPDRRLYAIFLIVLIDVLGLTIILPLLPFYTERYGAKPFVVGLLVSIYAVCQLISGPILGHWSDRIGRKPVLIFSQIGTLIGFLVLAFGNSLFWIFLSRMIDGLTAGNLSTAQAYITDVTNPKDRAKSLGKIGMAFGIGFFIGPALTAFLYRYGYKAPIFAAAFLSFSSIMASNFLLPSVRKEKVSPTQFKFSKAEVAAAFVNGARLASGSFIASILSLRKSFAKYFRDPVLSALLFEIALFYFAFSAYISGFALYAERRFTFAGVPFTPRQVGYAFAYFGFLQIIVQAVVIGRVVEKWGERRVTLIGFACCFIGYGLFSFIHEPLWILLIGIFTSFGAGVLRPVLTSEISGKVEPGERGTIMGVNQSLQSAAQILAPMLSTLIIQYANLSVWALFPSLVCLAGVVMVMRHVRNSRTAPVS